jgi:hypothetical protein
MKSWVLILAAIAILLLVWSVREKFEGTQNTGDIVDAKCSDGTIPDNEVGLCRQMVGGQPQHAKCPAGFTQFSIFAPPRQSIKCVRNFTMYDADRSQGPSAPPCKSPSHLVGMRSPPEEYGFDFTIKCIVPSGTTPAQANDISRTSGTTTGGTTGSTRGPNSGGGGDRRKQVFGPLFMGEGDGGVKGADSSKTNRYPQLLGGDGGKASTRIDGGGIVSPSGVGVTLPTPGSLGSNEDSKYLPFSREPGDMELIPDPYRVSQQFSSSSYSSKTEPVPFLTDFSAFQT